MVKLQVNHHHQDTLRIIEYYNKCFFLSLKYMITQSREATVTYSFAPFPYSVDLKILFLQLKEFAQGAESFHSGKVKGSQKDL